MTRTAWLVWLVVVQLGMLGWGGVAVGQGRADDSDAVTVDPAAKQLQATHGLFKRGLYKEAAEEYARFLRTYAEHALAGEARYGLAIAHFRQGQHEQAAPLLVQVLRDAKFAQRDEGLAVLGHCYLSLGEHAKALAAFDELLAKHANSKHAETAAINRVQVLYLADRKEEALEAARRFLEQYAQSGHRATALYFRALAQQGLGQHEAAGRTAAQIVRDYPGSPYQVDVQLLLGQSLEASGRLNQAIEAYREVARSAPTGRAAEARYGLGAALYKAGKYDEALAEFSAVLRTGEKSAVAPAALLQLGLTQVALGQYDDARTSLEAVVSKDAARRASALYGLVQADLAQKKFDSALGRLEELSKVKSPPVDGARLAFDRGVALMGLERFEQAAGVFEEVSRADARGALSADASYRRGYCLHRLAKYEHSSEALAGVPKDSAVAAAAAELGAENLFLSGKYDQARGAYEALVRSAKEDRQRDRFRLRLGQAAYFSGKYDEAIAELTPLAQSRRVTQDPELAPALLLLGDAMLQTGKNRESAAVLARYAPVASKKDSAEARFKLALAQLRSGEESSAQENLRKVIEEGGETAWAARGLFELGQVHFAKKRYEQAGEALKKLLAGNAPEELAVPASYMLAWIDFEARRYDEAAKAFGRVVQSYAKHPLAGDALYQQAVALREAGQNDRAAEVFRSYLDKHSDGPHAAGARQMIASTLNKAGKPAEAVKMLGELAANAKTRSDSVLYELAWAHRNAKDEKSAAGAYRQLVEQFPQSKLVHAARAEWGDLLFRQGQFAEAAGQLEKVVDQQGLDPRTLAVARYRLGSAYAEMKEWRKASGAFSRFVKDHAEDPLAASALYQGAEASISAGRQAEARELLSQLVKKHGTSDVAPVAMLKLGEVNAELGDHEAAAAAYQDFLNKFSQDKFAYLAQFGMGWSLENRKKYDEARQWYEKVTATHNGPTAARAQFQIGETYFAQQKYDQAVKALLAVEDVYGKTEWAPRALYEAGRALEQLKQPEKAKQQYAAVVEKYKDAPEAALAQKALKAMGG